MKIYAETDKFILREILLSDVNGMFELDSDPEVHRYLGNKPVKNIEQSLDMIKFIRQQYADYGIGRWAIINKENNDFVGWTGLKFVRDLTNNHKDFYDVGYRLIRRYWGKGIATETSKISLEYAFSTLKLNEVFASAHCENIASNHILQKVGLKFIETFYYEDLKCNWYRIDKNEYNLHL